MRLGQEAATIWKRRCSGPNGQAAVPPVGAEEKAALPSLPATQKDSLAQVRPRIGFSPCGEPCESQAVSPPAGFVVVQISPLKALATQRAPVQLTVRSGGPAGSTVRVQAAPPPVGLVEVKISPPLPTSTQKVSLVQEMPESALAFGIFAGTQELGPSAGLVVVQTPPL